MTDLNLKLKPEIKAEWLRRLRSGDYVQMNGGLGETMPDGQRRRCCLGVLVEIPGVQAQLDFEETTLLDGGESGCPMWETMLSAFIIPDDEPENSDRLQHAASAWIKTEIEIHDLIFLNDTEGWTFEQIANLIERYW